MDVPYLLNEFLVRVATEFMIEDKESAQPNELLSLSHFIGFSDSTLQEGQDVNNV